MADTPEMLDPETLSLSDITTARAAVEAIQNRWVGHKVALKEESKAFTVRKHAALYGQLARAYHVATQLLDPANAEVLDAIYAENKMQRDNRKGTNPYATVVRLLFNGDRSAYKYAATFRHLVDNGVRWQDVPLYLDHYGLAQTERNDRDKYGAGDPDAVVKQARFREFIRVMPNYGWVSMQALASELPREGGQMVALWGIIQAGQIQVRGSLPIPSKKIAAHVLKEANARVDDVEAEKAKQQQQYEWKVQQWREQNGQMDSAADALREAGFVEDAEEAEAKKLNSEARYEQEQAEREGLANQAVATLTMEMPVPRKRRKDASA